MLHYLVQCGLKYVAVEAAAQPVVAAPAAAAVAVDDPGTMRVELLHGNWWADPCRGGTDRGRTRPEAPLLFSRLWLQRSRDWYHIGPHASSVPMSGGLAGYSSSSSHTWGHEHQ